MDLGKQHCRMGENLDCKGIGANPDCVLHLSKKGKCKMAIRVKKFSIGLSSNGTCCKPADEAPIDINTTSMAVEPRADILMILSG
jgi:hypothetical protein